MSSNDDISQAAKAIEGIVKAVPIYQNALQPAAKQVGKGLETITKTIHVALAPVSALVWGYEKISDFLSWRLTEKLKNISPERISSPNLLVAGPVVESLKFAANEEVLRELYTNLLATSIDSQTAHNAHPGFVQIIQNISPDEAKILQFFSTSDTQPIIEVKAVSKKGGFFILCRNFSQIAKKANCQHLSLSSNYIDNLCRLGLFEIPEGKYLHDEKIYDELKQDSQMEFYHNQIKGDDDLSMDYVKKAIALTDLGKQFCSACVIDKGLQS